MSAPGASNPVESYCVGKHPFDSRAAAVSIAERRRRTDKSMRPYHCMACRKWHLGGIKKLPRVAVLSKRKTGKAPRRLQFAEVEA